MKPSLYLTQDETAERYRVSPATLAKWRSLGKGPPYHKFGRSVRYHVEQTDAWFASQIRGAE